MEARKMRRKGFNNLETVNKAWKEVALIENSTISSNDNHFKRRSNSMQHKKPLKRGDSYKKDGMT